MVHIKVRWGLYHIGILFGDTVNPKIVILFGSLLNVYGIPYSTCVLGAQDMQDQDPIRGRENMYPNGCAVQGS